MQSGLGMIGLKFLGAKQVILTFNTYDSMIEATKLEAVEWERVFTEIRPWPRADRAIDGEQFQISVAEIGQPSCPKLSSIQDYSLESGSKDEDFRDGHSVTKRGFWV
ncbi:hypothetical protein Peur_007869 [Populus x canadensis]